MNKIEKMVVFFILLISFSFALFPNQLVLEQGNRSIIKGNLEVEINPISVVCIDNPCMVAHNITISNNQNESFQVALYRKDGDNYTLIVELGEIAPLETAEFEVPMIYQYNSLTTYVGRYLLMSSNNLVKEFTIVESWEKYEKKSAELINIGAYVVAPVVALILLFILSLVVRDAESRKYGKKDEYTDKTLFEFPHGRTTGERIGNAMANPITWFVVLFFSILLVCLITFSIYQNYDIVTKLEIVFISFVASIIVPLILMILTWYADIYEREPFRFAVGMFIYGIFAAFVAFFLNNIFIYLAGKNPDVIPLGIMTALISIIASPVIEEFLKLFGLALFSRHPEFDDALDGLLYGFAIGIGFAMYENWFYFLTSVDPIVSGIDSWLSIILYRSLFNTIAHGCFVAFAGSILGYMKSHEKYRDVYHLALIPGLFVAILLHLIFNITAYLDIVNVGGYRAIIASYNPVYVTAVAVAFVIAYILSSLDTKKTKEIKKQQQNIE